MTAYLKFKDFSKRKASAKNYLNIFLMKSISYTENLDMHLKFKIMLNQQKFKSYFLVNKINSRCIYTNFSRGIQRLNSISKSEFKKKFSEAKITGFKKAIDCLPKLELALSECTSKKGYFNFTINPK